MNITLHSSGVGIHTKIAVHRGNEIIGRIKRFSRRYPWEITTHYGYTLAKYDDLGDAKAAAHTIEWPTRQSIYEIVCAGIEAQRRRYAENQRAAVVMRIARDIAKGSNSARVELYSVLAEIETFALDRTNFEGPQYPKPPEES